MSYRDDRQALALQVAELERENEDLKSELSELRDEARRAREARRDQARRDSRQGCAMCGGRLHAVAVFIGESNAPKSLKLSTARFAAPDGGFTRSAPLKSMVCSACGFVHHYIDLARADAALVTGDDELADE